MNQLIKKIAIDNNCSFLQASIIINHCKYLINRYLENFEVEEASKVCFDILGMSYEHALKLENQKLEVKK